MPDRVRDGRTYGCMSHFPDIRGSYSDGEDRKETGSGERHLSTRVGPGDAQSAEKIKA